MTTDRAEAGIWMTWLTTEHYNLQTQRAATIGEANGRASIFLGAVSAGLIALGFAATGHRSAGTTTFQVLVLSTLAVLGATTFLRCLQIAVDDWDYADRIQRVRRVYAELMPELGRKLQPMTQPEQSVVMLSPILGRLQALLTVAGSLGVITSIVLGADAGTLAYGLHAPLAIAIAVGAVTAAAAAICAIRFQIARWQGAEQVRRTKDR